MESESFTKLMRKSTRDVHSISDKLINAKLALTMSNDAVWAEGLLIFYEVFKFLERAIVETESEYLRQFHIQEMMRTEAFEKDLNYYLGPKWSNNYVPRVSVRRYLNYLGKLERNEPELLIAYIYHLYMGLLSGGQILSKKRTVSQTFKLANTSNNGGNAVTTFSCSIAELKAKLRKLTNEVCVQLNEDMQNKIIKEGRMVFQLNNEIVRTVQGTNQVFVIKCLIATALIFIPFYLQSLYYSET